MISSKKFFTGEVSPPCPVNLSEESKEKCKIPLPATHFVIAYPATGELTDHNFLLSPEGKFSAYGGFVYLDDTENVVGVNAFGQNGSDLEFEGPFLVDKRTEEGIGSSQRFQAVTLPELLKNGITHYCWLMPYEKDGDDRVMCTHGGFFYKTSQFSFYFSIKDSTSVLWEKEDEEGWSSFSAQVTRKLEEDYTHGSESSAIGQSSYDFNKMVQIGSQANSPIRRIYCRESPPIWECQLKQKWVPYTKQASDIIEANFIFSITGGKTSFVVPQGLISDGKYSIDFNDMKQVNADTGFTRTIRRRTNQKLDIKRMPIGRRMMLSRVQNLTQNPSVPPRFGNLRIILKGGKNVPQVSRLKPPSSFVVISTSFSDFVYITSTIHKTSDPKWEETCDIPSIKDNEPGSIIFTVHHRHTLRKKQSYLGRLSIPVSDIFSGGKDVAQINKRFDYEGKNVISRSDNKFPTLEVHFSFKERQTQKTTTKLGLSAILNDPVMERHRKLTSNPSRATINSNITNSIDSDKTFVGKHGKYIKGEMLGEGSFGKVFLCTNEETREKVALKIIQKTNEEELMELTKIEIQILHLLSSEYCISVIESTETLTSIYIIMEFCSGGDLFDNMTKLKVEDVVQVSKDLLSGIVYLHSIGICHRDIKPENIFHDTVSKKWKLADFGISTFFTEKDPYINGIVGSVPYIAPEMFFSKYTKAIDIWAAGVTIFVVLSKKFPWKSNVTEEVIDEIISDQVLWGPEWNGIPLARDFVSTLMDSDAETRISASGAFGHKWLIDKH